MKIVLLGYMGSGKSSIGKKLANILNVPFVDLDDLISEKEKLSIQDIFKIKGEIYFRKKEIESLNEILLQKDNFILAVGGGTPCYGSNMSVINDNSTSIYLKSSLESIYNRLSDQKKKQKRPLISEISNQELKEYFAKHLFERSPFYEQAHYIIKTDNKSKKEIAEEISSNMQ